MQEVVETIESQTIESETTESETIESETIESETIESETIESETFESETRIWGLSLETNFFPTQTDRYTESRMEVAPPPKNLNQQS